MELRKIGNGAFYFPGPVNVGMLSFGGSRVVLIDSGIDARHAKIIYEILNDNKYEITHILNTHSHADHIGGNHYLQKKTGCKILASPLETPSIRQPLIQSAVLYGGAPIPDLLNRFINANPSIVDPFNEERLNINDGEIEVLDLPGHSINQKGFKIGDIAYIADTLFQEEFFSKQQVPFNYDPILHLQTLENLKKVKARTFIGGHFQPVQDIGKMIEVNKRQINKALDFLVELLKIPQPQDRVTKAFMQNFNIQVKKPWQYFLFRATVNGYLSSLFKHGKVKYKILDYLLMWYSL
jgi:glyoxylase-like metal-dependent hydrolase (beta-lactamase superfamily II)